MNRRKSNKSVITCMHWRNQEDWLLERDQDLHLRHQLQLMAEEDIGGFGTLVGRKAADMEMEKQGVFGEQMFAGPGRDHGTQRHLWSLKIPPTHPPSPLFFSGEDLSDIPGDSSVPAWDHYLKFFRQVGKGQRFFLSFWVCDCLHLENNLRAWDILSCLNFWIHTFPSLLWFLALPFCIMCVTKSF